MNDRYLTYRAEDFAADEAFIQWVRGTSIYQKAWEQWVTAHPQLREETEIAREIVLNLQFGDSSNMNIDKDSLWNRIDAAIEAPTDITPLKRKKTHPVWYVLPIAAAASLAVLLLLNIFGKDLTVVNTERGVHLTQELPDGSVVELNAETEIAFGEKYWEQNRKVKLEGEAFFKVKEGSEFKVQTQEGEVRVLGTSFNVYQRGNEFEVKCVTGKVQVTTLNENHQEILEPGEGIVLNKGIGLQRLSFNTEDRVGWVNNVYSFENEPLGDILNEVERQYNIEIKASEELRARRYTITFYKENLDSTLYEISWPGNLEYILNDSKDYVVIKDKTE